ncbi:hypothetical protein ZIOFF_030492 [Zingiber officinale]|uniref:Retrovirus-related Pol polyprotein from transposon TNT 1-94-like beta-barrel domain-containing protein n=1 Tax=Zingiber officinale TaxID=94328 RepID=A0A8J5LBG7_ZINOF|nr:hypothetical protein ZIOFF_030492 [Zingiber officinale]
MGRKRWKGFQAEAAVELLNKVMQDKPLLPFLIPLFLFAWAVERWLVPFSNWVPLAAAVWATIQYGKFQRRQLAEDMNKRWKQLILNTSPNTPLEPCEWLNKLLVEVWPNYMEPRLSKRFFSMVEVIKALLQRSNNSLIHPRILLLQEKIELQEFSLGSCPPNLGRNGMQWISSGDQEGSAEFENLKGQILGLDPTPSLEQVYYKILSEEGRRRTMNNKGISTISPPIGETSVFIGSANKFRPGGTKGRGDRFCRHCKRTNHDSDFCWEKYPEKKPEKFKHNAKKAPNSGNIAIQKLENEEIIGSSVPSTTGLSSTDIVNLQHLLSRLQASSSVSTPAQAHTGIRSLGLSVTGPSFYSPWVIDSGATDHMTNAANSFISYSLSSGQEKVIIADGTKATVASKGSIKLTDHFFLSSALHVPSVSINLLSVSSITKQLRCSVTFFPDHCVFQDLETKQTIGTGREVGGLYYYQLETTSALNSAAKCLENKHQEILLWHSRLGHLTRYILKDVTFFESESYYSPQSRPQGENTTSSFIPQVVPHVIPSPISLDVMENGKDAPSLGSQPDPPVPAIVKNGCTCPEDVIGFAEIPERRGTAAYARSEEELPPAPHKEIRRGTAAAGTAQERRWRRRGRKEKAEIGEGGGITARDEEIGLRREMKRKEKRRRCALDAAGRNREQ